MADNAAKLFITPDELQKRSWELAEQIVASGFKPDYLVALWRGGAPVACYLHEFFSYIGWKIDHVPLCAKSYNGINQRSQVMLEGIESVIDKINAKGYRKILLVDDVLDTGNTLYHVKQRIPGDVRIAVPYDKYDAHAVEIKPDFTVVRLSKETWIVFPHELSDLTLSELKHKGNGLYESIRRIQPAGLPDH